jgi:hypothetical protein
MAGQYSERLRRSQKAEGEGNDEGGRMKGEAVLRRRAAKNAKSAKTAKSDVIPSESRNVSVSALRQLDTGNWELAPAGRVYGLRPAALPFLRPGLDT